jgi:hypothetical protein
MVCALSIEKISFSSPSEARCIASIAAIDEMEEAFDILVVSPSGAEDPLGELFGDHGL